MDKEWGIAAAMVVAVGLVCSPLYSVYAVVSGLAEHDAHRVASYVDFPALRSSLKARLTATALKSAPAKANSAEALGGALGLMLVDGLVDRMVTPEGLVALLGKASPSRGGSMDFRKVVGMLRMNGLTEVDLIASDDAQSYLAFRTDNLVTWRLVDFVTPDASSRQKTLAADFAR